MPKHHFLGLQARASKLVITIAPFVYATAVAIEIKRTKHIFGYKKKQC